MDVCACVSVCGCMSICVGVGVGASVGDGVGVCAGVCGVGSVRVWIRVLRWRWYRSCLRVFLNWRSC